LQSYLFVCTVEKNQFYFQSCATEDKKTIRATIIENCIENNLWKFAKKFWTIQKIMIFV